MDYGSLLKENQLVTIELGTSEHRYAYASRIEMVTDETIVLAAPTERGALVMLRPASEIKVFINHEQAKFYFYSNVIGHQVEPIPLLIVSKPDRIEKGQRRHYLRVRVVIFPLDSWVIDPDPEKCHPIKIATVDISGGGLRFVCKELLPIDAKIRLRLDLPFGCGNVEAIAKVIRVHERDNANRSRYEMAAIFSEITDNNRDKVCRFALKQQLEWHKRGLMGI